jgi:DNA-binding beta-propeller fold protein YncE
MSILKQVLSFLVIIQGISLAAQSHFVARYLPVGNTGTPRLLASDSEGNFFAVAMVQEISGRPQIRAMKTDSQGNVTASFDFGGSVFDLPSGAAVDPDGNLVIVGTTYSPDFP